jgi:hypothetical protein
MKYYEKRAKKSTFPLFDIDDFVNPKQPKKVKKWKKLLFFKNYLEIF